MTRKRRRLYAVLAGMAALGVAAFLVLSAFNDNLVFFYSPSDLTTKHVPFERQLRIGGLVEEHSVQHAADGKSVDFSISFPSVTQYSLFQVNEDQGVLLVYTGFALIMVGLLTKLYLRPFLERIQRKRRRPITLDPRWSAESSGEPQAPDREPASV